MADYPLGTGGETSLDGLLRRSRQRTTARRSASVGNLIIQFPLPLNNQQRQRIPPHDAERQDPLYSRYLRHTLHLERLRRAGGCCSGDCDAKPARPDVRLAVRCLRRRRRLRQNRRRRQGPFDWQLGRQWMGQLGQRSFNRLRKNVNWNLRRLGRLGRLGQGSLNRIRQERRALR